jgi:C-terminal processing protease CtpA/Prc
MEKKGFQWGWVPLILVLAGFAGGLIARKAQETGQPIASVGEPLFSQKILASRTAPSSISEGDYFYQLSRMLDQTYVDGVKDEDGLAKGSVRGMVGSLADPLSNYLPKEQMASMTRRLGGAYEGIGLELSLVLDQGELKKLQEKAPNLDSLMLLPVLTVTAVPEGTPAFKAGLLPGDRIVELDGRAVLSALDIKEIRDLQEKADKKLVPWAELEKARESFRKRAEHNYLASRARELMTTGKEGALSVVWRREGQTKKATISRNITQVQPLTKLADGSFKVRFIRGLQQEITSKQLGGKDVTLDLRGAGQGDFSVMKAALEELAVAGIYGELSTEKGGTPQPLAIRRGVPKPGRLTLLVDGTTRGAAEVFALALSARGQAQLKGKAMAGERVWIDTYSVQGGDGYTLVTGIFRPTSKGAAGAAR